MQGWECPRCHRVYAPWVAQCNACATAPGPVPSTPRDPRRPTPTGPRPYRTGDFPEFDPRITCGFGHFNVCAADYMPGDTVTLAMPGEDPHKFEVESVTLTNLGT